MASLPLVRIAGPVDGLPIISSLDNRRCLGIRAERRGVVETEGEGEGVRTGVEQAGDAGN